VGNVICPEVSPSLSELRSRGSTEGPSRKRLAALYKDPSEVRALEHVQGMRGGSQAQLMRCSDGHYYVVKFRNNPQGTKVLVNELLAHGIACVLGLPIPPCALVDVGQTLIELTTELIVQTPTGRIPCASGVAFGSRWCAGSWDAPFGLPPGRVENLEDFWGMFLFDLWTHHVDSRQVVFRRKPSERYQMLMIDNGFCFSTEEWRNHANFRQMCSFQGLSAYTKSKEMCSTERSLALCEPWLSRIENRFSLERLLSLVELIPAEWVQNPKEWEPLLVALDSRRCLVRELAKDALDSYKRCCHKVGL